MSKTVYIRDSQPLHVQSIEDEPSSSVVTFSGRRLELRVATTSSGGKDYIPEDMILRVEDRS